MFNDIQRIEVLTEALPFIRQFANSTIVIKYGGSAMKNQYLKNKIIYDLLFLHSLGIKLILVHGGGPIINTWLKRYNIEPKFNSGLRVTDKQTMEIVEMVLVGKVNKDLVSLLNRDNNCAIGLSGKDGNLVMASPLFDSQDNLVGKVDSINIEILDLLISNNYIPVIASVASGQNGQAYNINADTVAGSIAMSVGAEKLILLTDTPGIMSDISNSDTLLKQLTVNDAEMLKKKKIISDGMIPKVDCCIDALHGGVKSVHIIDGSIEHALLLEIFTESGIGSMITE